MFNCLSEETMSKIYLLSLCITVFAYAAEKESEDSTLSLTYAAQTNNEEAKKQASLQKAFFAEELIDNLALDNFSEAKKIIKNNIQLRKLYREFSRNISDGVYCTDNPEKYKRTSPMAYLICDYLIKGDAFYNQRFGILEMVLNKVFKNTTKVQDNINPKDAINLQGVATHTVIMIDGKEKTLDSTFLLPFILQWTLPGYAERSLALIKFIDKDKLYVNIIAGQITKGNEDFADVKLQKTKDEANFLQAQSERSGTTFSLYQRGVVGQIVKLVLSWSIK